MTLQHRINEAISGSGMTPAEFARAAKVSQSAITQLCKGQTMSLKADTAAYIELATGYRATWLALGKGPKKSNDAPASVTPMPVTHLQIDAVVQRLAEWLSFVEPSDRETAGVMLKQLAVDPAKTDVCAGVLRALIGIQEIPVVAAHSLK